MFSTILPKVLFLILSILPLGKLSLNYSAFSLFSSRLTNEAMVKLNRIVLWGFERKGLIINEGITIDARLVKSASRPICNGEKKKQRDKSKAPESKVDKNGNTLKLCRGLKSDRIIKNDVLQYDLKEYTSADVKNGLVLATTITPASSCQGKSETLGLNIDL